MSALALIVGALMLAAGGYEMVSGSGNILSERGWSAYIAGAVLVAGGAMTMALGLILRALDRLHGVLAAPEGRRLEPATQASFEPADGPALATDRAPAAEPAFVAGLEPVAATATLPITHAAFEEPNAISPDAVPVAAAPSTATPPASAVEPDHAELPPPERPFSEPWSADGGPTSRPEPALEDWHDARFADLEREMALPVVPESVPAESELSTPEPRTPEPRLEPHAGAPYAEEQPEPSRIAHQDSEPESVDGHATVSAREEPVPPPSPVIGRYESEGTTYVMYADGSIDAQSDANVYRFASMAELKAFIER